MGGKGITRKRVNAKKSSPSAGGGSGTVTNIATTGPITGGPITTTGTIGFDQSANFTWTGSHVFTVVLPQSSIVPTDPDDLVNKAYVDALIAGLSPQPSVLVATVAPLPACTPAGAGAGKTLTMNAVGILTVDGIATVLGDSILVKDQVDPIDNGVYTVTTEGTAGVAAVLTRRTNYDQTAEVVLGTMFGVSQGTQAGTVWVMISPNPVVVDTDPIVFTYFLTGATYSAGTGLTLGGNTFAVDVDPAGAIIFNGNAIAVNPDTVTIDIVGNMITFIGGSTDVTNNSLVTGATVTDALNTLANSLNPTFNDVLTNGNITSLSAVFDDGAGTETTYSPGIIDALGGLIFSTDTIIRIYDTTQSFYTFSINNSTGDFALGDIFGTFGTPYIQAQAASNDMLIWTQGAQLSLNALGSSIAELAASAEVHFAAPAVAINPLTGGYHFPPLDGTAGQSMVTDGAGIASWGNPTGNINIVPITAVNLKTLTDGSTLNTQVIYQVTDAGEGTTGVTGVLNIMAQDINVLQPSGQGYFTNLYTPSPTYCIMGYDVQTNKFTFVVEPVRNNKVYCGLDSQSLQLNDTALALFRFADDNWRDNTFNNVRIDNGAIAAGGTLTFKGCNWETIWVDFDNHDNLEFINQIFKGVANQLSGVPDMTIDGDIVSLECNDFYSSDSDVCIKNMGPGADITYVRVGWFSTIDMNSITDADLRFSNVGSTAFVSVNTDQAVRYCEFGNGVSVELVDATRNCNFLSGDQGGALGVGNFFGIRSTLINCNYGSNNPLECNSSILNGCTVNGGSGTNNLITGSNLTSCTVNFNGRSNCTLSGLTAQNQTITFTGDGQIISTVNMIHKFADNTARDAAITLPLAGMVCVSGSNLSYHDGSSWTNL